MSRESNIILNSPGLRFSTQGGKGAEESLPVGDGLERAWAVGKPFYYLFSPKGRMQAGAAVGLHFLSTHARGTVPLYHSF